MFQEVFACQVGLLDALLCKTVHDFRFRRNGSVVRSRHPASVLTLHAGAANQNILNGIVKHVSHVKHACDVWGRNDDCVRLTAIGFRLEEAVIQPILIPLTLYFCGIVLTCNFHIVLFLFYLYLDSGKALSFGVQKYKNNTDKYNLNNICSTLSHP